MIGFKDQNPSPSVSFMVFSACFYGICSAMMNIVNKFLLNSWQFNYPELILASQLLFTIFGLKLLKSCNKISLVSYSLQSAKSCALLSFFFSSNTCLGMLFQRECVCPVGARYMPLRNRRNPTAFTCPGHPLEVIPLVVLTMVKMRVSREIFNFYCFGDYCTVLTKSPQYIVSKHTKTSVEFSALSLIRV